MKENHHKQQWEYWREKYGKGFCREWRELSRSILLEYISAFVNKHGILPDDNILHKMVCDSVDRAQKAGWFEAPHDPFLPINEHLIDEAEESGEKCARWDSKPEKPCCDRVHDLHMIELCAYNNEKEKIEEELKADAPVV